ncbi:hypothetical protein BH11CYA1_BH11CYA1_12920 [soil metagenome]
MKAIKEIELRAGVRFKGTGLVDDLLDHHFEQKLLKELIGDGQVWIAETIPDTNTNANANTSTGEQTSAEAPLRVPVGFAIATVLGPLAYLEELDVLPDHGRKGLGRRLVETVADWARTQNFAHLTLSTFIKVAWNAPFYAKLGFEPLPKRQWERELEEIYMLELKLGLPVEQRTFMRLKLRA